MLKIKYSFRRRAGLTPTVLFMWCGLFFSLTAGIMSDFAVPWDETEILYELITIAGLLASGVLMDHFRRLALRLVLGGAVLGISASLYIQAAGLAPVAFILLRFGLSPLLVYAFWKAVDIIGRPHSYIPLTFAAFLSYVTLALCQHTQVLVHHFGAVSAVFCFLGAIFLLLVGRPGHRRQAAIPRNTLHRHPPAVPWPKSMLALLGLLLVLNQLFNSFDVIIYRRFPQMAGPDGRIYTVSLLLIGAGYLLGGIVVQKKGLPMLFVVACATVQVFLLVALVPHQAEVTTLVLPFYVLGSACIDLCLILSPILLRPATGRPLRCILGFVLFRVFKLYFIPSFFPEDWQQMPPDRLMIILAILLALAQMLLVLYLWANRRAARLAHMESQKGPPRVAPAPPPALPDSMTPRERDVAHLLLAGKDRNEIAKAMGIAFSTVNKHCVSIYRKTGCSSHLELLNKYGRLQGEDGGDSA